jgi:hypothetical protein
MAHFAKIEENTVTQVIVISNDVCGEPTLTFPDTDAAGRAFIANTLKFDGVWAQTSYSANFRGCYAGIGYTFDANAGEYGEFVPPPSIELDDEQ